MAPLPGMMNGTALSAPGAQPPPPGVSPQGAPGIMPPDGDGPDSEGAGDSDTTPSPQEQAQYDQFMAQIRILLYKDPNLTKALIQSLKTGDPVDALAHAALMAVQRVQAAATQAGDQLDPSILLHGGQEVVQDIADFSNQVSAAQGTPKYTDQQIQQAYLKAVDLYRQAAQQDGTLDQAGAQQDWTQAQQADQQGDIDKVVPGATEAAKALAPAAQGAEKAVTAGAVGAGVKVGRAAAKAAKKKGK